MDRRYWYPDEPPVPTLLPIMRCTIITWLSADTWQQRMSATTRLESGKLKTRFNWPNTTWPTSSKIIHWPPHPPSRIPGTYIATWSWASLCPWGGWAAWRAGWSEAHRGRGRSSSPPGTHDDWADGHLTNKSRSGLCHYRKSVSLG